MSDSKATKGDHSSLLRRKGKFIFELDADEDNKQNPIQAIQVLSDKCIMVRYKVTGLIKLFYVSVKVGRISTPPLIGPFLPPLAL